jgi:hypothetical protein
LASLIVDGRLVAEDAGSAEAIATRLTRLLSDSLAALGDKKPGSTGSNRQKHPLRRGRSAEPANI